MTLALVFADDPVELRLIRRSMPEQVDVEHRGAAETWRVAQDPRPDVIVICVDEPDELLSRARVWSGGVPVLWITDRYVELESAEVEMLHRPPYPNLLQRAIARLVDSR